VHCTHCTSDVIKNCASRWSITKNHNTMHGQKNVKLGKTFKERMAPNLIHHCHYPIQLYYFSSKRQCNFGSHTSCIRSVYYSVVCLATGPQPLPKRVLHTMQSSAFAFNSEYHLFYLRSSSSSLSLLRRLPVTSILLFLCIAYVFTHTHTYIYIYTLIATSKNGSIVS
jgi:hypothetical protein